jgi:hypothetical protein
MDSKMAADDAAVDIAGIVGIAHAVATRPPPAVKPPPSAGRPAPPSLPPEPPGLFDRTAFRKGTTNGAKARAPYDSSGRILCETCGEPIPDKVEIETKNGPREVSGGQNDHYPDTWADRKQAMREKARQTGKWQSRKESIDEYNERIRHICKECNEKHEFEGVPGTYVDRNRPANDNGSESTHDN